MRFRRIRDGQMVPDSEACDANGAMRDGYAASFSYGDRVAADGEYISFSAAFMDSAQPTVSPGAPTLTANDEAAVIARAAMIHRMNNAYLGDRAPAFSENMAQLAVAQARNDVARLQTNDAATAAYAAQLRIEADAAHARMTENLRNAWRN